MNLMKQNQIMIKISDIVLSISSSQPLESIRLEESYRDFMCTEEPVVTICACYSGLPQILLQDKDKIFDSEMVWSLYQENGRNIFVLTSPVLGPFPYRIAIFDRGFRKGNVFNHIPNPQETINELLPNPLEFPLSEALMICLLAQGRGIMVHACGVSVNGCGFLFAGNSTHGKTTMARLWKNKAVILNDDRIVIRNKEGRFWMYGTPWHGEYTGVSPQGVPIEKIFFLNHAERNNAVRCNGTDAVSMLLTRSFPPLWDAKGMQFSLDFCAKLVEAIPCYELKFFPDENIMDYVRCVN